MSELTAVVVDTSAAVLPDETELNSYRSPGEVMKFESV